MSTHNKTTLNIVTVSYSFTQFSTLAKIHTTTAREPSIYLPSMYLAILFILLFECHLIFFLQFTSHFSVNNPYQIFQVIFKEFAVMRRDESHLQLQGHIKALTGRNTTFK